MKQTKKTKKTESGRSMIEMVGVLAVMGLITVGAFVLITSAMKSQKLSRLDDDMSAIAAGVRLMFNTSADFKNASDDTLKAIGFDKSNSYGGEYHLLGPSDNDDNKQQFFVVVTGMSQSECNAMTSRSFPGGGTASGGSGSTDTSTGKFSFTVSSDGGCPDSNPAVKVTYGRNSD